MTRHTPRKSFGEVPPSIERFRRIRRGHLRRPPHPGIRAVKIRGHRGDNRNNNHGNDDEDLSEHHEFAFSSRVAAGYGRFSLLTYEPTASIWLVVSTSANAGIAPRPLRITVATS